MARAVSGDPGKAGSPGTPAVVESSLDNLRSEDVRFLEEAAALGPLHVRIPSDALVTERTRTPPAFPAAERLFLAESIRWVASAEIVDRSLVGEPEALDALAAAGSSVVVREEHDELALRSAVEAHGVGYRTVSRQARAGFPVGDPAPPPEGTPRVVITGCYDWLHSGHIRFFMDAAAYGPLYAVVGSDRNVELLKGPGHPLQHEEERRYMVGAVNSVHRCLVSSGEGWMDAEPEIDAIRPAFYVVNEDGDQPEKRDFCVAHGIEYVALQRKPHPGLPPRTSTDLRGF